MSVFNNTQGMINFIFPPRFERVFFPRNFKSFSKSECKILISNSKLPAPSTPWVSLWFNSVHYHWNVVCVRTQLARQLKRSSMIQWQVWVILFIPSDICGIFQRFSITHKNVAGVGELIGHSNKLSIFPLALLANLEYIKKNFNFLCSSSDNYNFSVELINLINDLLRSL